MVLDLCNATNKEISTISQYDKSVALLQMDFTRLIFLGIYLSSSLIWTLTMLWNSV